MTDVPPEMSGSKNPLILRNYRYIAPTCWKYLNLTTGAGGQSLGPGPTYTQDFQLTFKVDAAPVIMTYESELIFRIRCPINPQAMPVVPNFDVYNLPTQNIPAAGELGPLDGLSYQGQVLTKAGLLSGIEARLPLVRTKFKCAGQMLKRAWCSMSNMTFQSVNTPQYLNEVLLRKPIEDQRKRPDNYTTEYCMYRELNDPLCMGVEPPAANVQNPAANQIAGRYNVVNGDVNFGVSLGERGNGWSQWDNISFSTPWLDVTRNELVIDYRIPLTEILPVFKIGVIPMMMINSATIDLTLDFYHPSRWFISRLVYPPTTAETWLNISTVSFPDINPLAEMLLKPRVVGDRFLAPFLDYFTLEHTYDVPAGQRQDFMFNVLQFFRNVPFVSLSFLDAGTPAWADARLGAQGYNLDRPQLSVNGFGQYPTNDQYDGDGHYKLFGSRAENEIRQLPNEIQGAVIGRGGQAQQGGIALFAGGARHAGLGLTPTVPVTDLADYAYPLGPEDRARGGFYSLPPSVIVDGVRLLLGESAFPLTQQPIDFNSLYMYNRKHFEMYGRQFNVSRVSPLSRERQGDASYFFDLSHGPYTGFTIDSDSPLQLMGTIINESARQCTLRVCLTIWYSNNFNAMIASGGVVPTQ